MSNNLILNRLFTLATFRKIVNNENDNLYLNIVNKYIHPNPSNTNAEIISAIYDYMRKNYRNQYFYKNTIINKLLLGVHSINTTTALTEIPISTSKADFVLINGKAVVYEIKTELDNLERLDGQIHNYYKVFNHVCVLTCEENANILWNKLQGTDVGIYVLSKKETIKRLKEPTINNNQLDSNEIFKVLNKPEFEKIIIDYYGTLPQVSQIKFYSKCRELFNEIPFEVAYDLFLKALKNRNSVTNKDKFNDVPYEIKSLIYFSQYRESDYIDLENFLSLEIGGYN